jgi:hypothetical protein
MFENQLVKAQIFLDPIRDLMNSVALYAKVNRLAFGVL